MSSFALPIYITATELFSLKVRNETDQLNMEEIENSLFADDVTLAPRTEASFP